MSGHIPEHFIHELLERSDIVEIIGARVSLKRSGAQGWTGCCPFHQEKTPSFTVTPEKQFYHCFGCQAHGDVISFLMQCDGLSFVESIETLAQRLGLTVPHDLSSEGRESYAGLYDVLEKAAQYFESQLRNKLALNRSVGYLKSRGITGKVAKQFRLGFAPPGWQGLQEIFGNDPSGSVVSMLQAAGLMARKEGDLRGYDRFRDRIMFPIRDRRGRVLGFGGRTLDGSHPKYLNSPETPVFHKGQELYGIYEARFERGPLAEAIVVEGYLDVIALMQFGVQNVVATLGTAVTEKHIERLFQQVGTLVFCFDGDRAGKSAALRALSLVLPFMQAGRSVRFIFLPEGEDPDTFIRQQGASVFLDRVRTGVSLEDFLFENVAMGLDLTAIDGRARLMALAKPLIAKMPPGVFRHMMYEKLEQRAGFSNTQQTPARRGKSGRLAPIPALRSPVWRALTLLVQHRAILKEMNIPVFSSVLPSNIPEIKLFCATIEILRNDPDIAAEAIGEKLPEMYQKLWKSVDFVNVGVLSKQGVQEELEGVLRFVQEQQQAEALEQLLAKARRREELSSEEKARINQLIRNSKV